MPGGKIKAPHHYFTVLLRTSYGPWKLFPYHFVQEHAESVLKIISVLVLLDRRELGTFLRNKVFSSKHESVKEIFRHPNIIYNMSPSADHRMYFGIAESQREVIFQDQPSVWEARKFLC
jgi:hypothetical protein